MGGERPPQTIRGDAIPDELKAYPQWVGWRWEQREGKWTKPPFNPRTRGAAKSTDPATWSTYDDAIAALQDTDGGLGFVLSVMDPFVGVDLDACRDPQTGAINSAATTIIAALDSYTEVSPSGTGIRIIVRGTLPPGGRKHGWLEVYDQARYLTITGAHVDGTPRSIEERTSLLATLHSTYFPAPVASVDTPTSSGPAQRLELDDVGLLAKARAAKNGDRFARLWSGSLADVTGDHSAADLQLCGILAFWTDRDAARIDRLFRQSGLVRKKWDQKHYSDGRTYGQATVARAIAECKEIYTPRDEKPAAAKEPVALTTYTWGDLMQRQREPLVYQWPGWVVERKIVLVAGAGDSLKSWLCLYLGTMSAAGRPALEPDDLDALPCRQGQVLMVSGENGFDEDLRRLQLLQRGHRLPDDMLPFTLLPAEMLSFSDEDTWTAFEQLVADLKPRVIVIDSAISLADLENENDNAEVSRFMKRCIAPLARVYGATVFLIVHSPKPPAQKGVVLSDEQVARGASAWRNSSDSMLYVKRDRTLGDHAVVLRPAKVRVGQRHQPIWFKLEDTEVDADSNAVAVRVVYGGTFSEDTGQAESAKLAKAVQSAITIVKDAPDIQVKDLVTALIEAKLTKATARRAAKVLRGLHPWPSGPHAGKKQAVVAERSEGKKVFLTLEAGLEAPDDDEGEVPF